MKIKNLKLKIVGMHCTSCAISIDGELEDTDGVKKAVTNYAKQHTEVEFDPEKVSLDKIISVIRKIDDKYDAVVIDKK